MSPRETFRVNRTLTKGYNDLVYSHQVQTALNAAMLEYDQTLSIAPDVTTAAANRWRKEGADAFRRVFETLNADSVPPTRQTAGGLDHQV